MPALDPFAVIYAALSTIVDTEFAPELIVTVPDKLHDSVGYEGAQVGVYPDFSRPMPGDNAVMQHQVMVQFYNQYVKEVDNYEQADPRVITGFAHRFMRAVEHQQATAAGDNNVWYFTVQNIAYPDDPTGNKTRFVATILARGDNQALYETRG